MLQQITREEKLQALQDLQQGKHSPLLERLKAEHRQHIVVFALGQMDIPLLRFFCYHFPAPDEQDEHLVGAFYTGMAGLKSEGEAATYVAAFEQKNSQKIETLNTFLEKQEQNKAQ